jgi:dihydrofolate reductase
MKKPKQSAGDKDVRISGGANVIQQYLNAGVVDEFTIHYSPIVLGDGIRLFDKIDGSKFTFEIVGAISSPLVTHLHYKVNNE